VVIEPDFNCEIRTWKAVPEENTIGASIKRPADGDMALKENARPGNSIWWIASNEITELFTTFQVCSFQCMISIQGKPVKRLCLVSRCQRRPDRRRWQRRLPDTDLVEVPEYAAVDRHSPVSVEPQSPAVTPERLGHGQCNPPGIDNGNDHMVHLFSSYILDHQGTNRDNYRRILCFKRRYSDASFSLYRFSPSLEIGIDAICCSFQTHCVLCYPMKCHPPDDKRNADSGDQQRGKYDQTPSDCESVITDQFMTAPVAESAAGGICCMALWAVHHADSVTGIAVYGNFSSLFKQISFLTVLHSGSRAAVSCRVHPALFGDPFS
jgi:hypothetical protein